MPERTTESLDEHLAALSQLAESIAPPDAAALARLDDGLGDARKAVQRRAAEAAARLAERFPPVRDWLEKRLHAPNLRRRWGAIFACSLGGTIPFAARPALLELLGDPDGDVRWAAADLLKRLAVDARAEIVADLTEAARAASSRRKMALYCLRDLKAVEAGDVIELALADPDVECRLAGVALLAVIGADRAATAERIASLIGDAEPRMRRAAAGTLGKLGIDSPSVRRALETAVASDDESLARAARRSLRQLS